MKLSKKDKINELVNPGTTLFSAGNKPLPMQFIRTTEKFNVVTKLQYIGTGSKTG